MTMREAAQLAQGTANQQDIQKANSFGKQDIGAIEKTLADALQEYLKQQSERPHREDFENLNKI